MLRSSRSSSVVCGLPTRQELETRTKMSRFWLLLVSFLASTSSVCCQHPQSELLIRGSNLHILTRHHLQYYDEKLEHLSLVDVSELHGIESGCLSALPHLRSFYVWRAPKLVKLPHDFFHPTPSLFRSLRIVYSGLKDLPDLSGLAYQGPLMHIIDFEGNKIQKIKSRGISVRADQLILDNNEIKEIESFAFEGSELAELSLKGNVHLSMLYPNSFAGIKSIRELDVSGTSIVMLPAAGLSTLEILKAENVISLKTIPSIHDFTSLQEAWLTHHFHCCAFHFPELHDPMRHEQYLVYMKNLQKSCSRKSSRRRRHVESSSSQNEATTEMTETKTTTDRFDLDAIPSKNLEDLLQPWSELVIDPDDNGESQEYDDGFGTFHETPDTTSIKNISISCDNETEASFNKKRWNEVKCWPEADALNPCEDVLGSVGARVIGWGGSSAATFGNLGVAAVLLTRPLAPPRLLLLLLALADLATALYLLLVSAVDTYTSQNYFNYAYDWQYGFGCRIAGFLAVWGAQASLLALAALTLERWLAITKAMLPQQRMNPRGARFILVASILYSILLASAPLFGASDFSSTSICLPMRHQNWIDTLYLSCLLLGGLFCLLAVIGCYVHIYFTLAKDSSNCTMRSGDASVANKMAILITIHMSCCVPVAIVGFCALIGEPILGVHGAKLLLVLIYPLNALADPFLYAILTHQFRRDLYLLLDRYGMCSQRAQQYKLPGVVGRRRSQRRSSNSPRNRRPDGSLTTGYEDLLV